MPWTLIDLWASGLTELLSKGGSSLVSSTDVPEGHYAQDNMKSTVVPNRNMIMLSIAGGVAVALGAQNIAIGVHAGDHFVYPDCRPLFLSLASAAIFEGNKDFGDLAGIPVLAPFGNSSKADIAFEAIKLGVQFDQTWSCYKGGTYHCGRCGTCVERLEAINEAQERYVRESGGATAPLDLTTYEDIVYWRQAVTVQ